MKTKVADSEVRKYVTNIGIMVEFMIQRGLNQNRYPTDREENVKI